MTNRRGSFFGQNSLRVWTTQYCDKSKNYPNFQKVTIEAAALLSSSQNFLYMYGAIIIFGQLYTYFYGCSHLHMLWSPEIHSYVLACLNFMLFINFFVHHIYQYLIELIMYDIFILMSFKRATPVSTSCTSCKSKSRSVKTPSLRTTFRMSLKTMSSLLSTIHLKTHTTHCSNKLGWNGPKTPMHDDGNNLHQITK